MPYITKTYKLPAFIQGEVYSASDDRTRFSIIDNELAFISDYIGQGVIDGWTIENDGSAIFISAGIGIIGRDVVQTFGDYRFDIDSGEEVNVYVKKRDVTISGKSGPSNLVNLKTEDSSAPSIVSNIQSPALDEEGNVLEELNTYSQISLSWDKNTEKDFDKYLIYRATDSEDSFFLDETSQSFFIDSNLSAETTYVYTIYSQDYSGNISDGVESSYTTVEDNRIPLKPNNLRVYWNDNQCQILFDKSVSNYVKGYQLIINKIDVNDNVIDNVLDDFIIVDGSQSYIYNLEDVLENANIYKVEIYSVSENDVLSNALEKTIETSYNSLYNEISNVVIEEEQVIGAEAQDAIFKLKFQWDYDSSIISENIFPERFKITVIENSKITSFPIEFDAVNKVVNEIDGITSYEYEIVYFPVKNENGEVDNYVFKEYTPYVFIIQSIFNEHTTRGHVAKIDRTSVYSDIPEVSDVSHSRINLLDFQLFWDNPAYKYFSHNIIKIFYENESENVLVEKNIGKSSSYIIPEKYFDVNKNYQVSFISYDIFGKTSEEVVYTVLIENFSLPENPVNIDISAKDGTIILTWDTNDLNLIKNYNIYKSSVEDIAISFNDFYLLEDNIDALRGEYVDVDVRSEKEYHYIITAVDVLGRESYDPEIDGIYPDYFSSKTSYSGVLDPVTDVQITQVSDHSIKVEWSLGEDFFDGYQIYRSIGNKNSFQLLAQTSSSQNFYIDDNSLLYSNIPYYYYIVKFKSGGDYIISDSVVPPSNSVFLGRVSAAETSSDINVDISGRRELKNLRSILLQSLDEKINNHRHSYSENDDRRIDLLNDKYLEDWTTSDFITYSTTEDLSEDANYIVRISGTINEKFFKDEDGVVDPLFLYNARIGFPPVHYSFDYENNSLIFSQELFNDCVLITDETDPRYETCRQSPYLSEPIITVIASNLAQTQGQLSNGNIQNINAAQVGTGIIEEDKLSKIDHNGRTMEQLIPLQLLLERKDSYSFVLNEDIINSQTIFSGIDIDIENDRLNLGSATVFFDIVHVEGDELLAATSRGLLHSNNFGNNWVNVYNFSEPVFKLYNSDKWGIIAVSVNNIYKLERRQFTAWGKMSGLRYVKKIRDITEDNFGNLYIATDIGIFKLNVDKSYIEDTWEFLPEIDNESSQIYIIKYSVDEDILYASNEIGLFISTDLGLSWQYEDSIPLFSKIRDIKIENGHVFLLSDNNIYRKIIQSEVFLDFELISFLPTSVSYADKFVIFKNKFYILSDNGILSSLNTNNIYDDNIVLITETLGEIGFNGFRPFAFSLNIIDEFLFIGLEQKIFFIDINSEIKLQFEETQTIIPTFYQNNNRINYGYYFNNSGFISFPEIQEEDIDIFVANKYDIFFAENGGWIAQNPEGSFAIYKNSIPLYYSPSEITFNFNNFNNLTYPSFSEINSYYEKALEYELKLQDNINILTNQLETIDNVSGFLKQLYFDYNNFISMLYPDQRIINVDDNYYLFKFPSIVINPITKTISYSITGETSVSEEETENIVDIVAGRFNFVNNYKKYDVFNVSLINVSLTNSGEKTHQELEDGVEMVYSGLPENLSQASQVNLIKTGLFIKQKYGWQESEDQLIQEKLLTVSEIEESIDNISSTINGEEEFSSEINVNTIKYINDAIIKDNYIYVGGYEQLLRVNLEDYEIDFNLLNLRKREIVRKIKYIKNYYYVLTNFSIYRGESLDVLEEVEKTNLPSDLFNFTIINGTYVVSAVNGIYCKNNIREQWEHVFSSLFPVYSVFASDKLFTFVDGKFYVSLNGFAYNEVDVNVPEEMQVYDIIKMNANLFFATNNGVYTDKESFYSNRPRISNFENTKDYPILGISVYNNVLYATTINGQYFKFDANGKNIIYTEQLKVITKILSENNIYLVGEDKIVIEGREYPLLLNNGSLF